VLGMFEAGLLHIDKDGIISLRDGFDQTHPPQAFVQALNGRQASAHSADNRYFEWRNKQPSKSSKVIAHVRH
jgi:hypothetical protein